MDTAALLPLTVKFQDHARLTDLLGDELQCPGMRQDLLQFAAFHDDAPTACPAQLLPFTPRSRPVRRGAHS